MQRQRTRHTSPELLIRKALFAQGLRFRIQYPVPGMPRRSIDIAFPRRRVAIFVDGCFWHGCPEHGVAPKHNAAWWLRKLAENAARDASTDTLLTGQGWTVVRLWEHVGVQEAVDQIVTVLT